jgi:4-amino-4-deoxy-L-arabinose transferase-like glycosyltransferase
VSVHTQYTPARLTAPATVKLPRILLFLLAAAYILTGLFGRDPWKTDDAVGLATMLSALDLGGNAWFLPQIGSAPLPQDGPMSMWVGAACIHFLGPWLGEVIASRVTNVLWFSLTIGSIWYGTYLLGRRAEAQPLALPFGGEPTEKDYGRLLADAAVLLTLATVGILLRLHETSNAPVLVAFQAMTFYALARMLDKPKLGATILGCALAGAFLTKAWPGLLPVLLATLVALRPKGALWPRKHWILWALILAISLILAWWLPAKRLNSTWLNEWTHWNADFFAFPNPETLLRPIRDLPWFLWPTWPLAALALWQWRRWLAAPHLWIPSALLIGSLLVALIWSEPSEPEYMLFVVPCAVLGAFSLPTMRRGVVNTLDWFGLMCFSVTAVCVWVGWVALHFGIPRGISLNIARQTFGYEAHINLVSVLMALAVTACWIAMVVWRVRFHPSVLWRGAILCAVGITSTWMLLVLLWMPTVDYVRSYRPMSAQIKAELITLRQADPPTTCVRGQGLSAGPQASLYVFDRINFTYDSSCPIVLQQTSVKQLEEGLAGYAEGASVIWQGSRGADRFDRYRLLRVPTK